MKPLLLSTLLISLFAIAKAQPTLNQSDFQPVLETPFTQSIGNYVDVGPAGADVTWDFSNLVEESNFMAVYTDSDNAPHSDSFSGATYALENGTFTLLMFKSSASKLEVLGFDNQLGAQVYDNPETYIDFPLNYMDSGTDEFSGSWNFGGAVNRTGALEYEYDAYGTLVMPYGTVYDVIRVRQVETYEDETNQGTFGFECICYVWIQAGTGRPILEIFEADNYGQISTGSQWNEPNATGIEYVPAASVDIFPNPTQGLLNVSGIAGHITEFNVYDMLGHEVIHQENITTQQGATLTFDVSELTRGTYLLSFRDDSGQQHSRFVVR
jgi:hypothetical protein